MRRRLDISLLVSLYPAWTGITLLKKPLLRTHIFINCYPADRKSFFYHQPHASELRTFLEPLSPHLNPLHEPQSRFLNHQFSGTKVIHHESLNPLREPRSRFPTHQSSGTKIIHHGSNASIGDRHLLLYIGAFRNFVGLQQHLPLAWYRRAFPNLSPRSRLLHDYGEKLGTPSLRQNLRTLSFHHDGV